MSDEPGNHVDKLHDDYYLGYMRGIADCILRLDARRAYYETYRDGEAMKTHPATFAILDEMHVFLEAMFEKAKLDVVT